MRPGVVNGGLLTVFAALVALSGALISPAVADPVDRPDIAQERWAPSLEVQAYDGSPATLTVGTYEWVESLPDYKATLVDLTTSEQVPLRYGYADSDGGDLEGPYSVDTRASLPTGVVYEMTLKVRTVGFWHCSLQDPDGCSWLSGESATYKWQFEWDGESAVGHAPPKKDSTIGLSSRTPWGPRGWQVIVTLKSASVPLVNQLLRGQYRAGGRWVRDGAWRTNSRGRLTLQFRGTKAQAKYRFYFPGSQFARPSTSRAFSIKRR